MATETIEIHVSDSSRIQFTSSSSGMIVTVKSPDPRKLGGWTIRGSASLTAPAISGLLSLLKKGRS